MTPLTTDPFTGNLSRLLRETFESPPTTGGAYLDPGTGLFRTLEGISAVRASRTPVVGGPTIAAHSGHLLYSIRIMHAFLVGREPGPLDFPGSWGGQIVDADEWTTLKADLRAAYDALIATVESQGAWNEATIGEAMVILVHSAYHLGAIRHAVRMEERAIGAGLAGRPHMEETR
jgi:hypothetical protein